MSNSPYYYRLSQEQHESLIEDLRLCAGTLEMLHEYTLTADGRHCPKVALDCPAGLVYRKLDALWDELNNLEPISELEPAKHDTSQDSTHATIMKGFKRGWLVKYMEYEELQKEIVRLREHIETNETIEALLRENIDIQKHIIATYEAKAAG